MKNITIVMVAITKLKEAEYNPRELTDKQYADIKASMEKFGFVDPVIVNAGKGRKNVLIGGHQRIKIARDMGIEEVPVVYLNLSPEDERELNVRLNKNVGQWDWDMLANNFDEKALIGWGFNEKEFGVPNFEPEDINEQPSLDTPKSVTCPECGHEFTP